MKKKYEKLQMSVFSLKGQKHDRRIYKGVSPNVDFYSGLKCDKITYNGENLGYNKEKERRKTSLCYPLSCVYVSF